MVVENVFARPEDEGLVESAMVVGEAEVALVSVLHGGQLCPYIKG